jgi:hypothetical protein
VKIFARALMLSASFVLGCATLAHAQAPQPAPAAAPPIVPLKVQVTISTYQGDKKITSLPYSLVVNANDKGRTTSVDNGVQILIPMVTQDGKTTGPVYKDVGTSIRCSATGIDDGRFRLDMQVDDASVYGDSKIPSDGMHGPWIQSFRSTQILLMRDGQTTEYTTATDRVTGNVTKVEVTLTVVK